MNLLLHIDIHLQRVKYIINEHKCLFSYLSFSFKLRERVYKIGYKEKQSQGYLSYFLWWSSCGESFLFYGLIDFMLFLTLAWRKWLLQSEIFLSSSTQSTGFGSVCHEPCPTTDFFYYLFPLTGGSPHFRFRVPANCLASTFPCQATRVRSPSINIWSPLWPIFFLNGHSLMACYC